MSNQHKYFTIHKNDAGSEAFRDQYVQMLQHEHAEMLALLERGVGVCEFATWSADVAALIARVEATQKGGG